MPPDVKRLEEELNARKHAHYERFMRWYRDEVTEDLILWMLERISGMDGLIGRMDAHDAIRIAKEQGSLETVKEIAYGAMFRRYYSEREQKLEREFRELAEARGFDPKADWGEAGDIGDSRESFAV